ncbi:DUF799 domain-containing protein [Oryzomonas rubra]|uniref:Lipoprotein n=1 Tax=Oryzomonas rubra TaxID=2509454 RepID=A0A5A9XMB9_9BACT|nr:GNA1162 family protein [Oryzomonas rubra]KAA0894236.1 hypothetical protein ET418_04585 [Oryzomonas rubra]
MKGITILVLLVTILLAGCAHTPPPKDLTKFKVANPSSILVVPVVNQSVEVTAPDFFLSTVSVPLAERGYYVFPVNLVKRILEDEGLSDANLVHSASVEKVCNLFGSDSVLYVTIKEWNAQYLVLTTTVNVKLQYAIKDCKTGDTLWEHEQKMAYTPHNNSTGNPFADLIVMAVNAAVTKAAPNYVPLARQANARTFYGDGVGIPLGHYALVGVKQ